VVTLSISLVQLSFLEMLMGSGVHACIDRGKCALVYMRPSACLSSPAREGRNPGTATSTRTLRDVPTRKLEGRMQGEKSSMFLRGCCKPPAPIAH
jgi:hypothetical protein